MTGPDDPRVFRFDRKFIEMMFMYQKRSDKCPHGRCEHPALAHCFHTDGYIHCTDGCPCATQWRIEDNTAITDPVADGT